jgi:hypothetical protein
MLRALFCAVLVTALSTGNLIAADCCPRCGSRNVVGNETAAVCTECGQATILGLSVPLAGLLGGVLTASAVAVAYRLVRRVRCRHAGASAGPGQPATT